MTIAGRQLCLESFAMLTSGLRAAALVLCGVVLGCSPPPESIHPNREGDVADHEMFDWLVGKCLASPEVMFFYIRSMPVNRLRPEERLFDYELYPGSHFLEGGRTPQEAVDKEEKLYGFLPSNTQFSVTRIFKFDNRMDSPSYYFVGEVLGDPGGESLRFNVGGNLGTAVMPAAGDSPRERMATGGNPLSDWVEFCDPKDMPKERLDYLASLVPEEH